MANSLRNGQLPSQAPPHLPEALQAPTFPLWLALPHQLTALVLALALDTCLLPLLPAVPPTCQPLPPSGPSLPPPGPRLGLCPRLSGHQLQQVPWLSAPSPALFHPQPHVGRVLPHPDGQWRPRSGAGRRGTIPTPANWSPLLLQAGAPQAGPGERLAPYPGKGRAGASFPSAEKPCVCRSPADSYEQLN